MILYHFTKHENLDGIGKRGLVPAIGKNTDSGALTLGIPVVWFTSNSQPLWMVGLGYGTDMCMLTVDINRKRLHHWRSWLTNLEGDGIDENGQTASLRRNGNPRRAVRQGRREQTPRLPK